MGSCQPPSHIFPQGMLPLLPLRETRGEGVLVSWSGGKPKNFSALRAEIGWSMSLLMP